MRLKYVYGLWCRAAYLYAGLRFAIEIVVLSPGAQLNTTAIDWNLLLQTKSKPVIQKSMRLIYEPAREPIFAIPLGGRLRRSQKLSSAQLD